MLALFFIVRAVGALSPSTKLTEQLDKLEVAVDTALTPSVGLERVANLPWWWAPAVNWLTESKEFMTPGKNPNIPQPWRTSGEKLEIDGLKAKFGKVTEQIAAKMAPDVLFRLVDTIMKGDAVMKGEIHSPFALAGLCLTLGAQTPEEKEERIEAFSDLQPDMEAPDYKIDDASFESWMNRPMVQLMLSNLKVVYACGKAKRNKLSTVHAVITSPGTTFYKKAFADAWAAIQPQPGVELDAAWSREKMKEFANVNNIPKELMKLLQPFFDAAGREECPFPN